MPNAVPTFRLGGPTPPRFAQFDRRGSAASRGYDSRWERIREIILAAQPLCQSCKARGMVVPATLVHHLTPLAQGGTHHPDNLRPLCTSCHGRAHGGR